MWIVPLFTYFIFIFHELKSYDGATVYKCGLWKKWRRVLKSPIDKELYKQGYLYFKRILGGARGVMVIVIGNGHGDKSSNLGRD